MNTETESKDGNKTTEQLLKFQPLSDRIVVKAMPVEEVTANGIIIPATTSEAAKSPTIGTVIAVGPGRYSDAPNFVSHQINDKFFTDLRPIQMDVKVGDNVMWTKFAGSTLTIEGIECIIMHESDLIGIIG